MSIRTYIEKIKQRQGKVFWFVSLYLLSIFAVGAVFLIQHVLVIGLKAV